LGVQAAMLTQSFPALNQEIKLLFQKRGRGTSHRCFALGRAVCACTILVAAGLMRPRQSVTNTHTGTHKHTFTYMCTYTQTHTHKWIWANTAEIWIETMPTGSTRPRQSVYPVKG
jgi:hypothetical protein